MKTAYTANAMKPVRPKSLVAGLLLLSGMVKSFIAALPLVYTDTRHKFTLVFGAIVAALLIWHGFTGQKNIPRDELRISVTLGTMSLLLGLLIVFRPKVDFEPATIAVGALYLIAAVYYFRMALQERQSFRHVREP